MLQIYVKIYIAIQKSVGTLAYLRAQVEVAVDRKNRMAIIASAQGEKPLTCVLEVFLQQKLTWSSQEQVLAIWGTDILRRLSCGWYISHLWENLYNIYNLFPVVFQLFFFKKKLFS